MIRIVTDSTSDIPPDIAMELDIAVVPMIVEIDGASYEDGVNLTREQFYAGLDSYKTFPKTAAASPGKMADAYRAAKAAGADEIVSIHIARGLSGVCNSADVGAADVAGEGIRVRVVDSGSISLGLGWLAIEAAHLAKGGASVEQVVAHVESLRRRTRIFALADTLKYLRKSGRASMLVAGVGELLQLKLLISLSDGEIEQLDRVRARGRGLERMLEFVTEYIGQTRVRHLSIVTTSGDQRQDIELMKTRLSDVTPSEPLLEVVVTPVIGAHFGPMGLGVVVVNE
jgi:DegV family protein with EDD domain